MLDLLPITIIVLTKNEDLHLERLILNVNNIFNEIIILDSFSDDNTSLIAKKHSIKFVQNEFINFGAQRNYAINNIETLNDWIFFLDADETIDDSLITELIYIFSHNIIYDGFYINRKFIFMKKWIRFGGYYPIYLLRLFKKSKAYCSGIVNEHIEVSGNTKIIQRGNIVDENLNNFNFWINKHNKYSDLEAEEFFIKKREISKFKFFNQVDTKKYIKLKYYNSMPLFLRPFIYFLYRYFLRFGFLDGYKGFIYHFCQGLIFWFFVDVKIFEKIIKNEE